MWTRVLARETLRQMEVGGGIRNSVEKVDKKIYSWNSVWQMPINRNTTCHQICSIDHQGYPMLQAARRHLLATNMKFIWWECNYHSVVIDIIFILMNVNSKVGTAKRGHVKFPQRIQSQESGHDKVNNKNINWRFHWY